MKKAGATELVSHKRRKKKNHESEVSVRKKTQKLDFYLGVHMQMTARPLKRLIHKIDRGREQIVI